MKRLAALAALTISLAAVLAAEAAREDARYSIRPTESCLRALESGYTLVIFRSQARFGARAALEVRLMDGSPFPVGARDLPTDVGIGEVYLVFAWSDGQAASVARKIVRARSKLVPNAQIRLRVGRAGNVAWYTLGAWSRGTELGARRLVLRCLR